MKIGDEVRIDLLKVKGIIVDECIIEHERKKLHNFVVIYSTEEYGINKRPFPDTWLTTINELIPLEIAQDNLLKAILHNQFIDITLK